MTEQQPPQNPTPGTQRETFHQEFFRRAQEWINDMLVLIPELEGVAITPSWEIRQDRLPYGVVMGRNGPLRSPQEVLHMAEQLHGTLHIAMKNSMATLTAIDQQMGEMAKEIREKQAQLDDLNQKLGEPTTPVDAPGGTSPDGPTQG